jgi:endoglucanase
MPQLKQPLLSLLLCIAIAVTFPWARAQELTASASIPTATEIHTVYTVQSSTVFRNGQEIQLRGVNWFGLETGTHSPQGLWKRNLEDTLNEMQSLGINAVRLPLCPASLHGAVISNIDFSLNPKLQGLDSAQLLGKILDEMDQRNILVLLDDHSIDCQTISPLWYDASYTEQQWIADLQTMSRLGLSHPNILGIDLKNEPHGTVTWGTGNAATDWNLAAERGGSAVLAANPNILVFIQGLQEAPTCSAQGGNWWGGNLQPLACTPLNPALLPSNKTVLSPHIFGPDLYLQYYFASPSFPKNLPAVWDAQFGFSQKLGYSVIPGEWGGHYGTDAGDPRDVAFQDALVAYYAQHGICSTFYWAWNPNSPDIRGLLQDDWTTPWSGKLHMLTQYWQTCRNAPVDTQ